MRISDMTWPEYGQHVAKQITILPVGALAPHGPHLPLDTDSRIACYFADQAAAQVGGLVLPCLPYGQKTHAGRVGGEFPGAISTRTSSLINIVLDVLNASYEDGARRFFLINAHYANFWPLAEATEQFVTLRQDVKVVAASWWDFQLEKTREDIVRQTGVPRSEDHHAALVETSLMLHIDAASVRVDAICDNVSKRRARYLVAPFPSDLSTADGVVYRAVGSTAEIGERMCAEIVEGIVNALHRELS